MKKLLNILLAALVIASPLSANAFATTSVMWVATSSAFITPNTINGVNPYLHVPSTGTSTFSGGANIAGSVGIGTTTPSNKLEVNGTGWFSDSLSASYINALSTTATSTFNHWVKINSNSKGLITDHIWALDSSGLDIDNSVGTIVALFGAGNGQSATFYDGLTNYGLFTTSHINATSTNNSYFMGNLGIGTTTPTNKLEVSGNGYLSGNITVANATATGTATVLGATSLQGLTFTVATGTSATTTNFASNNATTSVFNSTLATITGLNWTNATGTSATSTNISSTNLTVTGTSVIGNGASQTLTQSGQTFIDTTSGQLRWYDGRKEQTITGTSSPSFSIASTTLDAYGKSPSTGTTTLLMATYPEAWTMQGYYCTASTTGAARVRFGDGTNWTEDTSCSTGAFVRTTTNNTWTAFEPLIFQASSTASTANRVTVTIVKNLTAD